jgi:hypothetical protein
MTASSFLDSNQPDPKPLAIRISGLKKLLTQYRSKGYGCAGFDTAEAHLITAQEALKVGSRAQAKMSYDAANEHFLKGLNEQVANGSARVRGLDYPRR